MAEKGVYIHFPFCESRCGYCDFYSTVNKEDVKEKYEKALIEKIKNERDFKADTLYLGGGTPTVFGDKRLENVIKTAREKFGEFEEITVEGNPADNLKSTFKVLKNAGVTRISLGAQTANERELKSLLRRHTFSDVERSVADLKSAGFKDFSLDIMLGIPHQTLKSLKDTLEKFVSLSPTHISAYMLKIEKGTAFYKNRKNLPLPSEDQVCDFYLYTVDFLEKHGFHQYEISNFSKKGFESKHNTLYWECKEYLGLGASAHGYVDNRRYYYSSSIDDFLNNKPPVFEGIGGTKDEKFMLKLRLKKGIDLSDFQEEFGEFSGEFFKKIEKYKALSLVHYDGKVLSFTRNGFLISNTILADILL